ncbi:hypothetical protein MMC10_007469 [Thelotrema lepadinum]|nr:hypothetical protein [Thelotrema lepadinum]
MFILLSLLSFLPTITFATPTYLNLTAISASNGLSTLECWQLTNLFTTSTQAGTAGTAVEQLGSASNASLTILLPNFNGGMHNAPSVQYVSFLSGKAVISLPNSTDTATIRGGKFGLIIAADTANVSTLGHNTTYPTDSETVALQIPTAGGIVPGHEVLHGGPCTAEEQDY